MNKRLIEMQAYTKAGILLKANHSKEFMEYYHKELEELKKPKAIVDNLNNERVATLIEEKPFQDGLSDDWNKK